MTAAWGVAVAAGFGCASEQTGMTTQHHQVVTPVGIWYSVEPLLSGDRGRLASRIDADLATISRMGLNTVFFRHIDPEVFAMAAATASRHHLKIVLPDRPAQYYAMTGEPGYRAAPARWVTGRRGSLDSVLGAVDLGCAADRTSAERIERVAAAYRANPSLPPTFAHTAGPVPPSVGVLAAASADTLTLPALPHRGTPGRPLMLLRCTHRPGEGSPQAVRRWLWQFHAALAKGLTGGLVIDQYRTIPGQGSALADPGGDVGVERVNAVKRMAARMQHWGPMLDHLRFEPLAAPPGAGDAVDITLFVRDKRRMLLVFNRSRAEYLRTTLALDDLIGGSPATRLVEVSGEADAALGMVTPARRGRITLPVDIAPGDARLYEVF